MLLVIGDRDVRNGADRVHSMYCLDKKAQGSRASPHRAGRRSIMLWLFFIVVTALNLALGVATAIYIRGQLDHLRTDEATEIAKAAAASTGGTRTRKAREPASEPPTADSKTAAPSSRLDRDEAVPADLAEPRDSLAGNHPPHPTDTDPAGDETGPVGAGSTGVDPEPAQPSAQGEIQSDDWAKVTAEIAKGEVREDFFENGSGGSSPLGDAATSDPPGPDDHPAAAEGAADHKSAETEALEAAAEDSAATDIDDDTEDLESISAALQRNAEWESRLVMMDSDLHLSAAANSADVAKALDRVSRLGRDYLADLATLRENFPQVDHPLPEVTLVREDLLADWEATAAAAQAALHELALLDARGDFASTQHQMRILWNRLLSECYRLRDRLQWAFAARATCDGIDSSNFPSERLDPRTGYLTPLGLHLHLRPWWDSAGRLHRPLLAALIDADRLREWNERLGHPAVNDVAVALANFIRQIPRQEAVFARLGAARFLLLSSELDARSWTQLVEKIRQSVETASFEYQGHAIQLTIAAAVAELSADDTSRSFFDRLETALAEAKRAGGNRTYADNKGQATPIVPANLKVHEQTIHVDASVSEPVAVES